MMQNATIHGRNRLRLMGLVLLALFFATTTVFAADLFGFKLNAGVGGTQSFLQKQGYKVQAKHSFSKPRLSNIEILDFKNDYLRDMQLWIACYKDRTYLYKWSGDLPAEAGSVDRLQRLLKYLTKTFGEPQLVHGAKTMDVKSLAAIADGKSEEGVLLVWKRDSEQVELSLLEPLLAGGKPSVDFLLRYISPAMEQEALAYERGK
ncbi:MAG: hypothetical protein EHM45_16400 [Desulfobacteraceae bacterium]|nr:MAG: hypothetical protein EHM45_16400 [Desulfobacteraceae bacterium]